MLSQNTKIKMDTWILSDISLLMITIEGFSKRIKSEVHIENDRAFHLYKTLGYHVEGICKKALCTDGKYFDEHYITRLLP